jgi:hypothetical protein
MAELRDAMSNNPTYRRSARIDLLIGAASPICARYHPMLRRDGQFNKDSTMK